MSKKTKETTHSIAGGSLDITLNGNGDVLEDSALQLTGKELDRVADISRRYTELAKLVDKAPQETKSGHDITYVEDGSVECGCTHISAVDIARVQKISAARRRR